MDSLLGNAGEDIADEDWSFDQDMVGSQYTGFTPETCKRLRQYEDEDVGGGRGHASLPADGGQSALPMHTWSSSDAPRTLVTERSRYVTAWDSNIGQLVKAFLDDELCNSMVGSISRDTLISLTLFMVTTFSNRILDALIRGDLPARAETDAGLKRELNAMRTAAQKDTDLPGIYGNFLADEHGISPNTSQMRRIIRHVRKYMDFEGADPAAINEADEIDRLFDPSLSHSETKHGHRRYLSGGAIGGVLQPPKDCRLAQVEDFCDRLEARLKDVATADKYKPMDWPLCEFGISWHLMFRLAQHECHTQSNYIMNLSEAVAVYLYGAPAYRIRQYVLYIIPYPFLLELAEIFVTKVGYGMVRFGGGFCHAFAGA